MGRRRSVCFSFLILATLVAGTAPAAAQGPCVRAVDPVINALVEQGLARSATFRRLYEQLADSDLIVHLERGPQPWLAAGFNQFVVNVGARRFLRITLNIAQANDEAVALLGHELQHAVELAEQPDVNDIAGYERLYRRIGYRSCARDQRCYDTAAAVTAGHVIFKELRQPGASPVSSLALAGGDEARHLPPSP